MADVLGQLLAPAAGVFLSPLPIVGVILMLLSPKAKVNGPAFLVGWIGALAIVFAIVLLVADPAKLNSDNGDMSTASAIVHLAAGAGLLFLALKQWKQRPKAGETPEVPKWMKGIDKVTPVVALGLGALLAGLNPKNLLLAISGAATIAGGDLSTTNEIIATIFFIVVASLSVGVPVIWFLISGESAAKKLESMRGWLEHNNALIMAVVLFLLGLSIVGKSLPGLFD